MPEQRPLSPSRLSREQGLNTSVKRQNVALLAILLGALSTVTTVSMDGVLPALPAMARYFRVDDGTIKYTVSVFMLGIAFGQLIHGPLADRFGRKPVLIVAAALFVASSLGCAMATSIETLLSLRFLQGMMACAGQIVSRAVIRDIATRDNAARMMSYVMVVHGGMPMVAPIISAWLITAFGWNASFKGMAIYAAGAGLCALLLLRETLRHPDTQALKPARMIGSYGVIIRNRQFWGYLLCTVSAYGGLAAFLTGSSPVLITMMGVTPETFAYLFSITMVGHLLGLLLGARLVRRMGLDRVLGLGCAGVLVFGLIMAVLGWARVDTPAAIVIPMFFFMAAFALIAPQGSAGAISPFPEIAGTASSLMGFVLFVFVAGSSALLSLLEDGTQRPMTAMVLISGMIGFVAYMLIIRRKAADEA